MLDEAKLKRIQELEEELKKLPKGYISKKFINGSYFYYHQWSSEGKKESKYLNDDELVMLNKAMNRKKDIRSQLFSLKKGLDPKDEGVITECYLMHKDIPVCLFALNNENGSLVSMGPIFNAKHMPLGTSGEYGFKSFSDWWIERSIPVSRSGLNKALETLNISSPLLLLTKCYGLSLSDQYWIKPVDSSLNWKVINFFENNFSEDLGEVLFGKEVDKDLLNLSSPDATSIGNLKKRWKIIDERRILIKGGSNPIRQEPINEVIASKVMDLLGISHVSYSLMISGGYPYSECEDFISSENEFIPAVQILSVRKRRNDESLYNHFIRCCNSLGINDAVDSINKMILVDYILLNEDRHLNNFGAIRDANTLKFSGMAPIFDTGSCLGFDKFSGDMNKKELITCKPFKKTHEEELKLITDFSFVSKDKLLQIPELVRQLFENNLYVIPDRDRIETIIRLLKERIDFLITKFSIK